MQNSIFFQDDLHNVCCLEDHVSVRIYIETYITHHKQHHIERLKIKKINKIKQYRYHNRFYTVIKQI